MDTITLTLTAATVLTGALTGEYQRRRLNTLDYRYPDETADLWPTPGRRHWVPVVLCVGLGLLVWRHISQGTPEHLPHLLPLAVAAPWLAAVDADVHRLPYRATLLTITLSIVGVITAAAVAGQPMMVVAGMLGWAITHGLFWLIHKLGRGSMGYGDVRLAGLIGLTTAPLAVWAPWAAILIGSLIASLWTLTRPRHPGRRHAYGPWLLLGWYITTLIA